MNNIIEKLGIVKGLLIGYFKGFLHCFNTGHGGSITYWYFKDNKATTRNRIVCMQCGKEHYKF